LGVALAMVGLVLAFTVAPMVNGASLDGLTTIGGQPVANLQLFEQKIFYFHMPVAVTSLLALVGTLVYSIAYLVKKDAAFDLRAKVCTEVSLVFILMTMITGELWERFDWGVWWTWEPRLTTYFILMLLIVAYFVLRQGVNEPGRRAALSAVWGIVSFIDVPVTFLVTRLVPSGVHPVVFTADSGLPPRMLLPLLTVMVGMLLLAVGLYRLRLAQQQDAQRLRVLHEAYARYQEQVFETIPGKGGN
jgi:heme exporter protein C